MIMILEQQGIGRLGLQLINATGTRRATRNKQLDSTRLPSINIKPLDQATYLLATPVGGSIYLYS
jgi:hypothetical protein